MKKFLLRASDNFGCTFILCAVCAVVLNACNLTRTVTTRSEAWRKGDTSVVIQTKTIETYDASKK